VVLPHVPMLVSDRWDGHRSAENLDSIHQPRPVSSLIRRCLPPENLPNGYRYPDALSS
jgi:hypothetical protein